MSSGSKRKVTQEYCTQISKKLSYILRHGALKEGLNIRSDGYVDVQEVLGVLPGCTLSDIQRIVRDDVKQRFNLKTESDKLIIKANQGHTIPNVVDLSLHYLTDVSFDIVHGTYFDYYQKIKLEGLSRMRRNHIHFAKGLNFICGLRRNAEIFIYINFLKAKLDGIQFYEAENGVVLSPGNSNGYIEPKYFLKVMDKDNQQILH
ncbi:hypothetical protein QAD02_001527 [Eretmocerus hayati]|uniref:Uncharacterized protein n=1 Tax=Eretmocerus hayati TaxID=131215 RepID=A0ACC2NGG1_9HYME|nr:hypothetical protein QAD02_001527 [Eretmocerus hayati]